MPSEIDEFSNDFEFESIETPKKRRGRPRKNKTIEFETQETPETVASTEPKKRRGRTPKNKIGESIGALLVPILIFTTWMIALGTKLPFLIMTQQESTGIAVPAGNILAKYFPDLANTLIKYGDGSNDIIALIFGIIAYYQGITIRMELQKSESDATFKNETFTEHSDTTDSHDETITTFTTGIRRMGHSFD